MNKITILHLGESLLVAFFYLLLAPWGWKLLEGVPPIAQFPSTGFDKYCEAITGDGAGLYPAYVFGPAPFDCEASTWRLLFTH
jgi:hypothetical protein